MTRAGYIAMLLLLGCGEAPETFERSAPMSSAIVAAELPDLTPRPGAARGEWAVALNDSCVSCHADEAKAWEGSRHHRADTNEAYRAAFAKEPSVFCTSCHAPEAADPRRPTRAESELGVGCVSCHVVGDAERYTVLAGPSAEDAPHALTPSPAFAENDACGSCHQFRFPGHGGHGGQAFMQTTVDEARRIGEPGAACADCHMNAGDHAFDHVRDPAWLASALTVTTHLGDGQLLVTLSQPRPGHAFPTGDLFRRLQIAVLWHDASGRLVRSDARYLARHFVMTRDYHHGRELVADDRVRSSPSVLAFEVPASARVARWSVTLQRVADVGTGEEPEAADIESEQRIHAGALRF